MNIRKTVAVAASVLTMTVAAIGVSTPASAQDWHHERGTGYHQGYAPNYHHFRGALSPRYRERVYRANPRFYHRSPVITEWNPGPGYTRRSLGWYNSQTGRWRATHPYRYHGSTASGIWIRL